VNGKSFNSSTTHHLPITTHSFKNVSRDSIFSKLRSTTSALKTRAAYPEYDISVVHSAPRLEGSDLWEIFSRNFKAVSGKAMAGVEELLEFLTKDGSKHGYCDPELFDAVGSKLVAAGFTVETEFDRERYDDYQFGITRGTGAIAESGTLVIDDFRTSRRLAGFTRTAQRDALLSRHDSLRPPASSDRTSRTNHMQPNCAQWSWSRSPRTGVAGPTPGPTAADPSGATRLTLPPHPLRSRYAHPTPSGRLSPVCSPQPFTCQASPSERAASQGCE
jgi:hypothetical protein